MKRALDQVREFQIAGRLRVGEELQIIDDGDAAGIVLIVGQQCQAMANSLASSTTGSLSLRARLMLEELGETLIAAAQGDIVETADGLADLAYVVVGTAVEWGIPLDEVFEEVQRSNLAKFPVCSDCKGKGVRASGVRIVGGTSLHRKDCDTCDGTGRVRVMDEHGKALKPEGWTRPDIAGVLDGTVKPAVQ